MTPQPTAGGARDGEPGVVPTAVGYVVIIVVEAAWVCLLVYLLATLVSWIV